MEEVKKENGSVLDDKTERGVGKEAQAEQSGSTGLGKFKDVNALLHAYAALEAEFTRRSQRLKVLEREAENGKAQQSSSPKAEATEEEGSEHAEKCAVSATESLKTPAAQEARATEAAEVCEPETERVTLAANREEGSLLPAVGSVRDTENKFADDELYSAVLANETVRLKVIGEYLSSIGKKGAPIVKGGTGTLAVQPQRAESIASAGVMALRMFKNASVK